MTIKHFLIGAVIAAILQTTALGKIIFDRAMQLQNGKEVVLQTQMRDPRDLFRGHYVTLNLSVGEVAEDKVEVNGEFKYKDPVFVALKKGEDEFWVAKAIYDKMPTGISDPVIKGKYQRAHKPKGETVLRHRIRFPFDRFFAAKKRAKELEKVRRDQKLGVVLSVGDNGEALIKGISVEGEMIYNEPIW